MRLKFFCSHRYIPIGSNRGENLIGFVTYAVEFRCTKCLRIKRDIGYSSEASAQRALERFKKVMRGYDD